MNAAFLEHPGPPEVIRYGPFPTPEPGPGQLRVAVRAASVNPIDTYIRSGAVAMKLPQPFVPGCDFAGVVDAVGPGVGRFRVGDRVWGSNQGLLGRQGTLAEFCCPDEAFTYPLPEGVEFEAAAATALVGITAHLGLVQFARVQPGEFLFVHGGTGGVGSMVVQIGRILGARVITTVGSEAKATLAKSLGAEFVIDYRTDDLAGKVREFTGGKGCQVWFETQREPDLLRTVELMAPRGRIILMAGRAAQPLLPVGPFYVKGLTIYGYAMFNMTPDEQSRCAQDLNQWLRTGSLKPLIGQRFPLSQAAAAHQLQEQNTLHKAGTLTGKIILTP